MSTAWSFHSLLLAACVGLIGGLSSGMCGISPGGALVVLSTLLLGAEQHVAQGISLAAQIPPTSLSGIRRYRAEGSHCSTRWLIWLAVGFLLGGVGGAALAGEASTLALQWSYVGYLGVLDAMLLIRSSAVRSSSNMTADLAEDRPWPALLGIGLLAGLSSGYLGIGGGLVIVVGLTTGLGVAQHRAQMVSLLLSIIPTTIPAAWVYWRGGRLPAWPILVAVIVGLWGGTDLGARAANRMKPTTLRWVLVIMVSAMAAYMACRALADKGGTEP